MASLEELLKDLADFLKQRSSNSFLEHAEPKHISLLVSNPRRRIPMATNHLILWLAVQHNIIELVEMFISQGADINELGPNKWSLLHVAASHGHRKIIKLLIKNGARIDATLSESKKVGFTPLHLAVSKNHIKCAKLLLEHGANIKSYETDICHPIHIAVFKGFTEMTDLLLDYDADINLRFTNQFFEIFQPCMHVDLWINENLPLLHYSILLKYGNLTELLIGRGADINLKTNSQKTTLMQATEVDDVYLVEFLMSEDKS